MGASNQAVGRNLATMSGFINCTEQWFGELRCTLSSAAVEIEMAILGDASHRLLSMVIQRISMD